MERDIMNRTEKKPEVCAEERWRAKAGDEVNQSNLPASTQTHLAWMRTRMSLYPVVVVAVLLCLIGLLAFFTILFGAELPWPGRS